MSSVKETVGAFDKEHGKCVSKDGWVIFADGARREQNHWGALVDPPTNEFDRLKIVKIYREVLLERASEKFAVRKHDLLENARLAQRAGHPPPDSVEEAKAELEQLARDVRIAQRKLNQVLADIAKTPEAQRAESIAATKAAHAAACDSFTNAIREIKV